MIHFFGTQKHLYTIQNFIDLWAEECRAHVTVHSYERLSLSQPLAAGVCIFADLERLRPAEMWFAKKLAQCLSAWPAQYTIVNHPARYRGRFELLRLLQERGSNHFRVRRLDDPLDDLVYPVFLRNELEHTVRSPLLHSPKELRAALRRLPFRVRRQKKHLMVVEFCDCRDADGVIRKYSALKVQGGFIPRHIFFSQDWFIKHATLVTEDLVAEEDRFMNEFPHAELVREAFEFCGVDYGRIDYSFHRGQIQVWEINTNPTILRGREKIVPARMPTQIWFAKTFSAALRKLSASAPAGTGFPFRSPGLLGARAVQFYSRTVHEERP